MSNQITRISTDASGTQSNGWSGYEIFSPDGTKVAFLGRGTNLVPGDTNAVGDVFVKDLVTGTVTRVSTDASGAQANQESGSFRGIAFSPDGTKIAHDSAASNLVAGDTNDVRDIFIKDLATGAITRISTGASGAQANGASWVGVFSPDGTKVLFYSYASNLVPGDTNNASDIFVKNLLTGAISRISTDAVGAQANNASSNAIFSPDGTKVAFASYATNFVAGDTNNTFDIFVKDLATGTVTRVSTDAAGQQGNAGAGIFVFSPDGTKIAFESNATNFVTGDTNGVRDVFVKDLVTGAVTRVSTDAAGVQGNGDSFNIVFSPDGTKVAFSSSATNLVPGDTNGANDIFVKNLSTGAISLISNSASGAQGNSDSNSVVFSPDGTKLSIFSFASNLVPNDTNGTADVFVVTLDFSQPLDTYPTNLHEIVQGNLSDYVNDPANDHRQGTPLQWAYDFAVVEGTLVHAVADGTVSYVNDGLTGDFLGYGNVITVRSVDDQGSEYFTTYAHLQANSTTLEIGDPVSAGDVIANSGVSGTFTGGRSHPHLHIQFGRDTYSPNLNTTNHSDPGVIADGQGDNVTPAFFPDLTMHFDRSPNLSDRIYYGTPGIDRFFGNGLGDTVYGDAGDDYLMGGVGADSFTGGGGNDQLIGNNGGDTLIGGEGNDYVDGVGGHDNMAGGPGNDLYVVNTGQDVVTELPGEGTNDAISTFVSMTIPNNVESITQLGMGNTFEIGNSLDNLMIGNVGNNALAGGPGNDTLRGGPGNDTLSGNAGIDTVNYADATGGVSVDLSLAGPQAVGGGRGTDTLSSLENILGSPFNDTLLGNTGTNTLTGGAGSDILIGGPGNDIMAGGAGNDFYFVDAGGDVVTETLNNGTVDVVFSFISYTLPSNVESLSLIGASNNFGVGNSLNNGILGNAGNNALAGGQGNDALQGSLGADSLAGDAGNDTFSYDAPNEGGDTISDFQPGADKFNFRGLNFHLPAGALQAANFAIDAPADANDYFVFLTSTKTLTYDSDGSGLGAAVPIARLTNGVTIGASDIVIIPPGAMVIGET